MQKSFLRLLTYVAITALIATFNTRALAQVTTSGLTGIVRGADGNPVSGAKVVAVYTPTNATFTDFTNSTGRYSFRALPVGGPYTVTSSAAGFTDNTVNSLNGEEITTQLGSDLEVNLTIKSDVLQLEKFVASGTRTELDSKAQGASALVTREQIEVKATTQRSFADLVSATPQITLRSLSGDREEAQITALGQNNRYNSIMIDGNRINDQFGLNATGLASFFNPISLETVEQFSVLTGTPDVRYSGFTGATINFVTKSGTNDFHGSAYYIFSGDHLAGVQMQGPDARTLVQSGVKVVPKLERTSKGLTFGGPLWKDHVFFFLNWEKFERIGAPNQAGLPTVNAADLALINARVAAISKINYGTLGGNANSVANEEKKLLKLDWQINSQHRLSARYSTTEGQVPQFGSFTTTSAGTGLDVSPNSAVGGAATAFDSHFYAQTRKEKSLSGTLTSQWTPDLTTELRWSRVKQDQYTPTAVTGPEIDIFGVTGTNQGGATVTNGVVVLGTERFRHGNQINVDTKNYSADADYQRNNVTYSLGVSVEDNSYYNLFRQFSYGVFNYASPAAFAADTPISFQRNFTDLAIKGSYADISQYTQSGIYGKFKWDASNRLKVEGGVRLDRSSSNTVPAFNQQFLTDTGMRNDGTIDGALDVSPRIGFNYSLDDERKTQVRGTAGYFVGRAPWVFWSNSYGNTGAGTFTSLTIPTGGLTGYLTNTFDPANPYGTATQTGSSRAEIDLADSQMHMPSLWRGNVGVDRKLSFLNSVVSVDITYSINDETLFIRNDNLKIKGTAADGRTYFFGNPSTLANAKYANYTNIYHLSNVEAGKSTYATVKWDRPMKDQWSFSVAYTRGRATEAQASGQTTASGMWQRNAVFNQGNVETGISDFEIKDRFQAAVARQFTFFPKAKSTISLYYEGRTGSPYSYAYANDLNLDGMAGNDLVSVPSSATDARFDFSGMTTDQVTKYLGFFNNLSKYAGGYAPKNVFFQPWVNRLDLRVSQEIPLHFRTAKLRLELDFTNFGNFISKKIFDYVERAPSTVNDVFDRRLISAAQITSAGLIQPQLFTANFRNTTTGATTSAGVYNNNPVTPPAGTTLTSTTNALTAPSDFLIDNTMSRWRIQIAAKLSF